MNDFSVSAAPPISMAEIKLARGGPAPGLKGPAAAEEAAKNFEAVFLTQFVEAMFAGVKSDGAFGGGHAEEMWRGFLSEHIATAFAERGGVGIAEQVRAQIIKMEEAL